MRITLFAVLVWLAQLATAQAPERLEWLTAESGLAAGDVGSLFLKVDPPAASEIKVFANESTLVWIPQPPSLDCNSLPLQQRRSQTTRATNAPSLVKVCFSSARPATFSLVATLTTPTSDPANRVTAKSSSTITINAETFWVSPLITTAIPMLVAFLGGLASTYGGERIKLALEQRRTAQESDTKSRKLLVEQLLPELTRHRDQLAAMVTVEDGHAVPEHLSLAGLNQFNGMVDVLRSFTGRVGDVRVVDAVASYGKHVATLNDALNAQESKPTSFAKVRRLAVVCNQALAAILSRRN